MQRPFNATFFAAVAVVLPVLFLAVALQSDYLARTFLASRRLHSALQEEIRKKKARRSWVGRTFGGLHLSFAESIVGGAAGVVLLEGSYGEYQALRALEQQHATLGLQSSVMQAVIVLIIAAVVATIWRVRNLSEK